MIKIGENYTASRDKHCWVLAETYEAERKRDHKDGEWKKGDKYMAVRETFHGNLRQCCDKLLDREAGRAAGDATSIIYALNEARDMIVSALEQVEG